MTYFGTVRGRLGYAVDSWLVYATGGWAYGHETFQGQVTVLTTTSSFGYSTDRTGWTAGGGVEMSIDSHWSWRAEYLYFDLGTWTITSPTSLGTSVTKINFSDNVGRLGVNYRF